MLSIGSYSLEKRGGRRARPGRHVIAPQMNLKHAQQVRRQVENETQAHRIMGARRVEFCRRAATQLDKGVTQLRRVTGGVSAAYEQRATGDLYKFMKLCNLYVSGALHSS